MAHQKNSIRWDLLAANLIFYPQKHEVNPPVTNLYFRFQPNQREEIKEFIESFAQTIEKHIQLERQKYPEEYESLSPDDIVLDDNLTRKISPTVSKIRRGTSEFSPSNQLPHVVPRTGLCQHYDGQDDNHKPHHILGCECPIPYNERKASAFLREHQENDCYQFFKINGKGFFNLEIIKTLLLTGDMDPVLRVCSHPDVQYADWMNVCSCDCGAVGSDMGWGYLYRQALKMYLVLNILYCFPDLRHTTATKTKASEENPIQDYRDTKLYQVMLHSVTQNQESEITAYLHRQFFGIIDRQFSCSFEIRNGLDWPALANVVKNNPDKYGSTIYDSNFPFGQIPFEVFLNCQGPVPYLPLPTERALASRILAQKGLPTELILLIMDYTGYSESEPDRLLVVPHDPLHPENREELGKHLDRCWQLLVRCGVFAQALGEKIRWRSEISSIFVRNLRGREKESLDIRDYADHSSDDETASG